MGGSSSKSGSQTTEPWAAQQPYLKFGFQQAQNLYNSGGPDYYGGSTVVPFSRQTEQALGMMENRALQGNPLNQMAQQYAANTLSGQYFPDLSSLMGSGGPMSFATSGGGGGGGGGGGSTFNAEGLSAVDDVTAQTGYNDIAQGALENIAQGGGSILNNPALASLHSTAAGDYLNANPYIDSMYNTAARNLSQNFNESVTPALNATFAAGGRTGSGMHQGAFSDATQNLGQSLGDLSNQIYYQNYVNERNNQLNAAGQLGQFGLADTSNIANASNILGGFGQQAADRDLTAQQSNQQMQDAMRQYEMRAREASAANNTQAGIAAGNNAAQRYAAELSAKSAMNSNLLNYFNNERNRQQQMAGMAPGLANTDYADMERLMGVGSMIEGQAGRYLQDDINRFNHYQNLPQQNLQNYMQAIQGNYGSSTTDRSYSNPIGGAMGGALAGAQLGSVIPGLGTTVGAIGGGLLGAFM